MMILRTDTVACFTGQLKLKIPWKNLYNEPTIAQLDGLYVLAVPNTSVSFSLFLYNLYT